MNKSLIEALQRLQLGNPFTALAEPVMLMAFLLCAVGFIFNVLGEKDDPLRAFVRCGVAVIFIAALPLWATWVRDGLYFLPYSLMDFHASLNGIYVNITKSTQAGVTHSAWDFSIFDLSGSALLDIVVVMMMELIATLGSIVAIPLLFVQIGMEKFVQTAMPVAIAALTVPAVRNHGQGFLAFWVSILVWPLFFAVTTIIAGTVFTVSNNLGQLWNELGNGGGVFSNFIAPFCAGAILIGGILSTPPLAYSLCAHGGAALSGPSPNLITFLR